MIAVIGDGSLSGGEAFEGLDNAGEYATNFIVVVNDNEMSIAENHGGLYGNLAELRATQGIDATIINPRFATGIDCEVLEGLRADHQVVVTLENGVVDGGLGEKVARFYGNSDMRVLVKGLKKEFYDKVPYGELMERNRLMPKQIVEDVKAVLSSK